MGSSLRTLAKFVDDAKNARTLPLREVATAIRTVRISVRHLRHTVSPNQTP